MFNKVYCAYCSKENTNHFEAVNGEVICEECLSVEYDQWETDNWVDSDHYEREEDV